MTYAKDILYNGKSYFNEAIKNGVPLDKVLSAMLVFICQFDQAFKFNCIEFKSLGIDKCAFENLTQSEKICAVINAIIARENAIIVDLEKYRKYITPTPAGSGVSTPTNTAFTDQLVKTTSTDPTAGYLFDKIKSTQPDVIAIINNILTFTGFVPVGAVIMIDKSAIGKFESTGLGKANSDCCCFAISDGRNGTENRLGRFPRWATTIATIGVTGGTSNFTVNHKNIENYSLSLNGNVGDSQFSQPPYINTEPFQIDTSRVGNTEVFAVTDRPGVPVAIEGLLHNHADDLAVEWVNTDLTPIPLLPLYIDEIPIVRIK